jgi:hypothetical protein
MFAIARNKALQALRSRWQKPTEEEGAAEVVDSADDPEAAVHEKTRSIVLRKCLSRLSPIQREIVDLVYYIPREIGGRGRADRWNSRRYCKDTHVSRPQPHYGIAGRSRDWTSSKTAELSGAINDEMRPRLSHVGSSAAQASLDLAVKRKFSAAETRQIGIARTSDCNPPPQVPASFCLRLVTAMVEHVADADGPPGGLLGRLDLPGEVQHQPPQQLRLDLEPILAAARRGEDRLAPEHGEMTIEIMMARSRAFQHRSALVTACTWSFSNPSCASAARSIHARRPFSAGT